MNNMDVPIVGINAVSEKVGLEPILLSRWSAIKKIYFNDYFTE